VRSFSRVLECNIFSRIWRVPVSGTVVTKMDLFARFVSIRGEGFRRWWRVVVDGDDYGEFGIDECQGIVVLDRPLEIEERV